MTELPEPLHPSTSCLEQVSILLVDDNPANLLSLRVLLDDLGGNLVEARSGEEAIERVKADEFAVILLDVLMPGINGFETARVIRVQERSRHTPVIFLTASDIDRSQLEEGYALGAVDFLVKPILPVAIQAKVRGFVQLFQDKQRTKHDADQLRLLVEGATDYAIFRLDPQGNVASWNAGAERIKQYRPDEIIGQHFSRFYPQEAIDRGWPIHELKVAKAEGRIEDEGWRIRKDGTQFWANVVITALHDARGTFRGFSKITRDLTERKKSEENARRLVEEATARRVAEEIAGLIQEQQEWLRVTLASIGDAVIATDTQGHVTFLNGVAQELTGWTQGDSTGQPLEEVFVIFNEQTRQPVENPVEKVLRHGATVGLGNHTILIGKDGTERPIDDSAAPIRDAAGKLIGVVLTFRDVTEQRQAEMELRESERELADFFDNATIGLHWVGPDGTILRANQAELNMLGYNREEYVGRHIAEFHADEDVIADILKRLRAGENLNEYPARLRCKDTSIRDVVIDSSVMRKDGEFVHTRCLTRDITEQKRAEQRFTRFMQHLPGLAWIKDLRGRYIYANDAARKAFGTPGAELDGRTDDEVFSPATAAQFKQNDLQAMSCDVQVVESLQQEDGVVHYSLVNKFPILGSDGQAALIGGIAIDITDQRRAESALRESEEKLRLLANTIPQLAWMAQPDGYIFWYNRRWYEYTGTTPEQMEGWGWQSVHDPDVLPNVLERWKGSIASGEPFDMVFPLKGADEQFRPFLTRVNPLRDDEGRILYWFGTNTDISDIKRMEEALRDADRRKDEFLATLAHELRNPLAPIRNSLQILKMPRVDATTAQQTRDMMERQVHHLVRLVDDLLDVSRVMRGKIELRKELVELATVVARAVETAEPLIEVQGHRLDLSLPSESLLLDADPVRLAQAIGNLLTNSAKYTDPNGHIWLTARREGDQAVLQVRDDGIGIAPDMLPHVFELFVQADHASTKAQGGLGIGLTLVKNLVEMHNGTVEASSGGLGKGSEFNVRLPLMVQERQPEEKDNGELQQESARSSGHRLLVVDDNQDAAISLAMLLRLQGHEVRVAHSGPAALEMTKAYTPAVVFLDIGMPGMDGYEVARRMRQQPGLVKVVLAAMTGWGQQEDRRRSAEAGFDYHLVKPPEPKAIESVLAALPQCP